MSRPSIELLETRQLLATIAVTTLDDSGAGSLRDAIAAAASGDTIDLTGLTGTSYLWSRLDIATSLTIVGPGKDKLTLDGQNFTQMFNMNSAVTVNISGMTMARGYAASGGAIYVRGGAKLSLEDVKISNCYASQGGAINSYGNTNGSLSLNHSVLQGNSAGFAGAAIYAGSCVVTLQNSSVVENVVNVTGASNSSYGRAINVTSPTTLTMTNSTIAGNQGGALLIRYGTTGQIDHCTIANNTDKGYGGGISIYSSSYVKYYDNIIANNETTDLQRISSSSQFYDFHGNIVGKYVPIAGGTDYLTSYPSYDNRIGTVSAPLTVQLNDMATSPDGIPFISIPTDSEARDYYSYYGYTQPTVDQLGRPRDEYPDAGAYEWISPMPVFTTAATLPGGRWHTYYEQIINISDGDVNDTLAITAISKPAWMSVAPLSNGRAKIYGTPTDNVAQNLVITLNGSDGTFDTQQDFTISLAGNTDPVTTTTTLPDIIAGQAYSQTIEFTDADGDAFTIDDHNPEDWLSVSTNNPGAALLAGTPGLDDIGDYTVQLDVNDGLSSSVQTFHFAVKAPPPAKDDSGVLTITGTNADDSIVVWTRRGGQLRVVQNGVITNFSTAEVTQVVVDGNDGDDSIAVNILDLPSHVEGGAGNDTLTGGVANDWLSGDDGDDSILGLDGADTLDGGAGNDNMTGGNGQNRFFGGDGDDFMVGGPNKDKMYADAGNDTLYGGRNNDLLHGGEGDDQLFGQNNKDILCGDDGADTLYGGTHDDLLEGGNGDDYLNGQSGTDTLQGDAGNDSLFSRGDRLIDILIGGDDQDSVQRDPGETSDAEIILA